ncbi:hypothetical protein PCASD_02253 [Puccinia coronata f. sp. avenae]|uniref:RNI-like protein n=1 Tax=Puccinia coronata f. sp. avenae TaxID=200324 RepID=A0A2N5VI49_9BASI|nr:hypothetical protein PCASD_02253 [Puccinia coronata f. sp. avenae]
MARPSRFNQPTNTDQNPVQAATSNPTAPPSDQGDANADNDQPETNPTPGPSRPAGNSAVTGPTSALTSFLKEQGIRPRQVNRFTPLRPPQASTSTAIPEVDEGTHDQPDEESDPDSDDLDGKPDRKIKPKVTTKEATASTSKAAAPSLSKKNEDQPWEPSKPKPGKYADRKPGLITTCAECGKRFTVTRTTVNPTPAPAAKKRKTTKNQVVRQPWSESSIQTLQMACITIIARNTESIEELGHVGSVNLEKICQIVCKHRELTSENLPLFVDATHSDLKLFDCINLREPHLQSIAYFCPRLEKLTLNLCSSTSGLLNDQSLDVIGARWLDSNQRLSIANAGIHNGATGEALTDAAPLKSVGTTVERLDISQNKKLTDAVLDSIQQFCSQLTYLDLNGLKELSTKGSRRCLCNLNNRAPRAQTSEPVSLHQSKPPPNSFSFLALFLTIGNEALSSILDHSARTLQMLDLNSVDELRAEALERLAKETIHLEWLDVSFVRDVDDFIIKAFLDHMKHLKSLLVYGNNRVSDLCPTRKGVAIKGQERSIVVT